MTVNIKSVAELLNLRVITWDIVYTATQEDGVMLKLNEQILREFPDNQHEISQELK